MSFAVGIVTGIAAMGIFCGFGALLVVHAGSESDKRGLGRHRPGALRGGELPATHVATLPVVAPQKDPDGPGSSTAARVNGDPRPRLKRQAHAYKTN